MKLIQIGFGNFISDNRVIAVVSPDSAPVKRIIQQAKEKTLLVDATYGRKTMSVLVMDSGHVVLSALSPQTLATRMEQTEEES